MNMLIVMNYELLMTALYKLAFIGNYLTPMQKGKIGGIRIPEP